MAILQNCFCCSLAIAAGFLAVFLLVKWNTHLAIIGNFLISQVAYLIAFAFEMLWILEAYMPLPTAAILLCAGYFTLALFAALLIHGLATKNTFCLVAWMLAISILTFPEAGLVIYMSIQYWRIESLYGMTELACWVARIMVNVIAVLVVQSLYSFWKEEELVAKRLHELNMATIQMQRDASLNSLNSQYYQNNAFDGSAERLNSNLKRAYSTPQLWTGSIPNNINYPLDSSYQYYPQSEFNASVFTPNILGGNNNDTFEISAKKCQSLMDLRNIEDQFHITAHEKTWDPWITENLAQMNGDGGGVVLPHPNYAFSLDRNGKLATTTATSATNGKLQKFSSLNDLSGGGAHVIKNRTGFYAQPLPDYGVPIYYGPLDGPDFLIYKKQMDKMSSKNSLSNTSTDDVQKYRDVAL